MKKIIISNELCIGCGACTAIDPEHFEFADDGLPEVITHENLESSELQDAIAGCPTGAISINEVVENDVPIEAV